MIFYNFESFFVLAVICFWYFPKWSESFVLGRRIRQPRTTRQTWNNSRRSNNFYDQSLLVTFSTLQDASSTNLTPSQQTTSEVVDNRPHDHRAKEARKARRLNTVFRYLYRHNNINDNESDTSNLSSREYLKQHGGYIDKDLEELSKIFPPLLELDVDRHLKPKMRFLKETVLAMKGATSTSSTTTIITTLPEQVRNILPPHYFGARLERIIAPRHAFLVYSKLPHGRDLLQGTQSSSSSSSRPGILSVPSLIQGSEALNQADSTLWQEFLISCRATQQFAALCNRWARERQQQKQDDTSATTTTANIQLTNSNIDNKQTIITAKQVEAFDFLFGRGLMAAARDELCQPNNRWALDQLNITSGDIIELLIQHGANPLERDNRGVSLLHWAAGCGNLGGVKALLPHFLQSTSTSSSTSARKALASKKNNGFFVQAERDGATPLHWAAAGANSHEFGVGGRPDICRFILSQVLDSEGAQKSRQLVNQLTRDGNSALMWAAWSGTLETVKFLIRHRADPSVANRNGCTVAHWASSGGNVKVCQYLYETVGVDFTEPNFGGNTPLTHAVAFGRVEVVEWLRRDVISKNDDMDSVAAGLAWDFVDWTDGDEKRQQVLKLFEDWDSHEQN